MNFAIIGATGNVGRKTIEVLEKSRIKIDNLFLVASKKSAGNKLLFKKKEIVIEQLEKYDFSKAEITIFAAGSEIAKEWVSIASKKTIVIDNSSFFRTKNDVPLVVPEVNPYDIKKHRKTNIIANPNCSTIQMLVALKPIHDRYKILNINVSTYQAVSGSGKSGVDELLQQTHNYLNQQKIQPSIYPKQIGFNVIPFVDSFCENDYTKEEMKMVWETQKILDKNISVNATAVRVPVLVGHSESITIETAKSLDIEIVKEDFKKQKGIQLMDDPNNDEYPTAFENGHGTDDVFVGRVRRSLDNDKVLNIWVVADNVRKGAALNSVQIAEELIKGDA